ncbi:MAG: hypothetical protein SGPRY_003699 [Prymnesium sp.]
MERRWSTPGWREEKRSSRPLLQRLTDTVVCAVYILAGTLIFRYTSTKPAASCDDNVTRVELCEESWSFMDALYFSMVTMSTVGYGDLSPDKRSGGLLFFTIVYIVTGVVVAGTMALLCTIASSLRLPWDTATSGISLHIICARDFAPISRAVRIANQSGQVAAFMHILISVSLLAAIIKDIDELRSWRREELDRANHVLGTMNVNYIMSLDQDGGGIDRFEFVTGMLVNSCEEDRLLHPRAGKTVNVLSQIVSEADVNMLWAQFEAIDASGDGIIRLIKKPCGLDWLNKWSKVLDKPMEEDRTLYLQDHGKSETEKSAVAKKIARSCK